jgi:GNAT superfamily N-acetyltransferase
MLAAPVDSEPMPLSIGIDLRAATADDLPAIAALREAAGWAVHPWALRAILEPPRARCLLAIDTEGRGVAVGSGISYGRLGIVGNMVVVPEHRRQGIGTAILEGILAFLEERGSSRVELSATDLGRPLYARYGFEPDLGGVSAVVSRYALRGDADIELRVAGPEALASLAEFDAPRFGGDRVPLLRMMVADRARAVITAVRDGSIVGWGWVRPEADRLGPLVADSPTVASTLVGEAFRLMPQTPTLRLNLPPGNRAGAEALRAAGATLEAWGGRMARGPNVPRRNETIYAGAVGALG